MGSPLEEFRREFRNIIQRMGLPPDSCVALRQHFENSQSPCRVYCIWLLYHATLEQDLILQAHACQLLLAERLRIHNYPKFVEMALIASLWEFKLVLLVFFAENISAIMVGENWDQARLLTRKLVRRARLETICRLSTNNVSSEMMELFNRIKDAVLGNFIINGMFTNESLE